MNKVKLGAIAEIQAGPFGTQLHKNEYVSEGTPMINSKNIGHGEIIDSNFDFVPSSVCHRLPQYILKSGDIVFGRAGTIDRHAYVDEEYDGSFQGTNCIRIRCKEKKLSLYVSYYLWLRELKSKIENAAGGSIQAYITTDLLKNIDIQIPADYAEKAFVLRQIDQKIENNNRINDNLQRQLKLLYDYWFTQFDFPDETGRPYRTSGGKMQIDPTLRRPIPVGWEVETLKNNRLASLIPTGVERFQTKIYYATADVIGTDIGNGSPIAYETRENRANMQPTMFSVWFAKMKKSIKHLFLNREMQDFIQNSILSTGFCGLQCTENYFEYVASFIEHSYFEATKDVYAHGATQEAVNNGDLAKIVFIVPPEDVLLAYHEKTKHLYSQISHNKMENKKLIDLRDWLLPLLMNGQATLAD